MSDLQTSLLVIGAVVVVAVYGYNRLQERSLRRRMQQVFGATHDDVLLKAGVESALADGRLEPQLLPREPEPAATPPASPPAAATDEESGTKFDPLLDAVAEIRAEGPIADAHIGELMSRVAACGKPVQLAGYEVGRSRWEDVARGQGGRYSRLRVSLQLVNRSGSVNAAQLASFGDAVRSSAARMGAKASCPDPAATLKCALELDAFCSRVDNAVGINIIAPDGVRFSGPQIRQLAEAAGFHLEPDGVFHFRNEHRQTLFTLDNHEPAPFLPESIRGISTRGITLLLDVPRVANGMEALNLMGEIARQLAAALGGNLVDDNRAPLSEAAFARIREQVEVLHAAMEAHSIPAGGTRAQRLFS